MQNIMDIEKRPQNSVFLIENWHLTDGLVYESIFQTKISLLPYVFVRLALKPHLARLYYFSLQPEYCIRLLPGVLMYR